MPKQFMKPSLKLLGFFGPLFVCIELCPSQQSVSHVWTEPPLPWYKPVLCIDQGDNMVLPVRIIPVNLESDAVPLCYQAPRGLL